MEGVDNSLLILLLILLLGLFIPELFKRFKLPFVTSIILVGAALGPFGFDYIQPNPVIEFFGFLGFTFLMFMAGLETKLEYIKKSIDRVEVLALLNGGIPFVVGIFVTRWLGYDWPAAFLVGTIFISSSIAIIIPSLKSAGLFKKREGQMIAAAVIIEDAVSLILLAVIFQSIQPVSTLPLPFYLIVLVSVVYLIYRYLPILASRYLEANKGEEDREHEDQLRFIIVVLMAVLLFFSFLGVHPILASFVVGVMLNKVITSKIIYSKLHTLGYGLFVPVFFFIIGMDLDLGSVFRLDFKNIGILVLILVPIITKFVSGFIAGKLVGFSNETSAIFGSVSITQLTTTLAATYTASAVGLIDQQITSAVIFVSVITTILGPLLLKYFHTEHIEKGMK